MRKVHMINFLQFEEGTDDEADDFDDEIENEVP